MNETPEQKAIKEFVERAANRIRAIETGNNDEVHEQLVREGANQRPARTGEGTRRAGVHLMSRLTKLKRALGDRNKVTGRLKAQVRESTKACKTYEKRAESYRTAAEREKKTGNPGDALSRFRHWRDELHRERARLATLQGQLKASRVKASKWRSAIAKASRGFDIQRTAGFVGRFEGYRARIYRDAVGVETIGYGETDRAVIARYRGKAMSEPAARKQLAKRLGGFAAFVDRAVRVALNGVQKAGLTSFTYNCGQGGFASSTLLTELNRGHYNTVPGQLMRWTKGGKRTLPGLVTRRRAEGALFSRGRW